jgi:hypothetical protein
MPKKTIKTEEKNTQKVFVKQLLFKKGETYLLKGSGEKVATYNEIDFPTKEDDPECEQGYDIVEKSTGRIIMTCSQNSKIKWSPSGEIEVEVKKHEDPKPIKEN